MANLVVHEELTHRHTEETDPHLDAGYDGEYRFVAFGDPIVCVECENKTEHIFEEQKACECLNRNFP